MALNLKNKTPDIRFLDEMRKVLYDQKWAEKAANQELYYMYRGLRKRKGLRYDITIIPPKMLGKEFVKTKGHYHIGNYGEIYIVLSGKAIYLMQKAISKSDFQKISDVFAIKAGKGDIVVIPAGYGHITINPSKNKKLVMANWVSEKCKSDYKPIEEMNGACYYYTVKGWTKNKKYSEVPKIYFKQPSRTMPKNLNFLNS
ncbi:MAG TPA: glucose-6-phosphate isomerase [Candidatus Parcubacteria bacterium]|nr:glucose-6-phosphate isomerase [Candidatus Parcubacteria bacterium]